MAQFSEQLELYYDEEDDDQYIDLKSQDPTFARNFNKEFLWLF